MPTRNFSIQTDGLFDQYSNLDYQSQLAKRQVERDAENARSEFDRIMALPFRQSLRTDFTPADVENIQLTRDAEPYSATVSKTSTSICCGWNV
jgi:predicted component of type VI protein secretion system